MIIILPILFLQNYILFEPRRVYVCQTGGANIYYVNMQFQDGLHNNNCCAK